MVSFGSFCPPYGKVDWFLTEITVIQESDALAGCY